MPLSLAAWPPIRRRALEPRTGGGSITCSGSGTPGPPKSPGAFRCVSLDITSPRGSAVGDELIRVVVRDVALLGEQLRVEEGLLRLLDVLGRRPTDRLALGVRRVQQLQLRLE